MPSCTSAPSALSGRWRQLRTDRPAPASGIMRAAIWVCQADARCAGHAVRAIKPGWRLPLRPTGRAPGADRRASASRAGFGQDWRGRRGPARARGAGPKHRAESSRGRSFDSVVLSHAESCYPRPASAARKRRRAAAQPSSITFNSTLARQGERRSHAGDHLAGEVGEQPGPLCGTEYRPRRRWQWSFHAAWKVPAAKDMDEAENPPEALDPKIAGSRCDQHQGQPDLPPQPVAPASLRGERTIAPQRDRRSTVGHG